MFKKSIFYTIIAIVAILIICLISVQMYWIKNAYQLKQIHFNEKVSSVLNKVVSHTEDLSFSFYLYGRSYIAPGDGVMVLKAGQNEQSPPDTVKLFNAFAYTTRPGDTCFYTTDVSYYDAPAFVNIALRFEYLKSDSLPDIELKNSELRNLTFDNFRERMDENLPIIKRIKIAMLDSVLNALLRENNINTQSGFALRKKGAVDFEYVSDSSLLKANTSVAFSAMLFENIAYTTPYELVLYINNKDGIVNQSLTRALSVSLAIIAMLTAAFIYFSRTVLRQRKLSEMKTGFINNMTHEFMTPVANISLALETIEKLKNNPSNYNDKIMQIIANENNHLKENIDKILQVAVLEKDNILLNKVPVNIHTLLDKVINSFTIQLENQYSRLEFNKNADHPVIVADETHITNLFINIIDNAIKYAGTDNSPLIKINTGNANNKLWVSIADNGVGMTAETRKNIFDKFYRAEKGNLHDVKGFGLGLSYVKSIADAHDITIDVKSSPGKGTIFTIWFNTSRK